MQLGLFAGFPHSICFYSGSLSLSYLLGHGCVWLFGFSCCLWGMMMNLFQLCCCASEHLAELSRSARGHKEKPWQHIKTISSLSQWSPHLISQEYTTYGEQRAEAGVLQTIGINNQGENGIRRIDIGDRKERGKGGKQAVLLYLRTMQGHHWSV